MQTSLPLAGGQPQWLMFLCEAPTTTVVCPFAILPLQYTQLVRIVHLTETFIEDLTSLLGFQGNSKA